MTEENLFLLSLYESDDPKFWEEYNKFLHTEMNEDVKEEENALVE